MDIVTILYFRDVCGNGGVHSVTVFRYQNSESNLYKIVRRCGNFLWKYFLCKESNVVVSTK